MDKLIEKAEYLESLQFGVVDFIEVDGYDTEFHFEADGMSCSIYEDEFEIGDSVSQIMRAATFYSCCGDPLDKDIMMCPSCREHC